ncbi:MAG: LysR family transcriptional regulator [Planktomarina sp.]|uniref:LysR family transcriptional regulator n=1 Tax=Halocynthiibacter sp. TaxID=1979210 RepID=UPI003C57952C
MPDIEQLRAFVVAEENGSFSAAARALGKAQSAISAAIANLEIDLDVTLFDRAGYRPELTQQGQVVLGYAKSVLESMDALMGQAETLSTRSEARFTFYIEDGLLVARLRDLLSGLANHFTGLELRVEEVPRAQILLAVEGGVADLALISRMEGLSAAWLSRGIGFQRLVPVCHCDHPLAQWAEVSRAELVKHRQFVSDGAPISPNIWRSDGVKTRMSLISDGLGWGELPADLVAEAVLTGHLKVLNYDFAQNSILESVGIISAHKAATGPVMRWLLSEFASWDQRAWIGDSRVGRRAS